MKPDIFISYSTKDTEVAEAAREALEAQDWRCWIAPRDISPGQDWSAAIIDALDACRVFVLIFSSHSNQSEQVKREIENAVSQRLPILPLRIEDVELSRQMRYFIGTPHWLNAVKGPLEPHLDTLVSAVQKLLAGEVLPPTPIAAVKRHNFPHTITSFIGRRNEKSEVKQLLSEKRLVTVCGAGGCGKTRLALEIGHELHPEFTDGAWMVELAALTEPELVPQAVATVLDVREQAGHPLAETLVEALQTRHLLLLLDNCEHLMQPCAQLVHDLLKSCPELRILATSREALAVPGEWPWRLANLPLPHPDKMPPHDQLHEFDSINLFIERARSHAPNFEITAHNAQAVTQICYRLDGIPLAIELACARVKMMTPEKIAERLDDCFRLLTGGNRTALPRQQTLRAAIDWSYDLLDENERRLLHRVSVFASGWTLEAAEKICSDDVLDEYEVMDYLSQLVDKSLVIAEHHNEVTRYRLLETVRAYGRDKLRESDEEEALCGRHASYFLALAEEAAPAFADDPKAADQEETRRDELRPEQDNMRAAFNWLLTQEAGNGAARLSLAMAGFRERMGHFSESQTALVRSLEKDDALDEKLRAALCKEIGWFAYLQGDYPTAAKLQEQSLAIYRAAALSNEEADVLNDLAVTYMAQNRIEEARAGLQNSIEIVRAANDAFNLAQRLLNLALLEINEENFETAHQMLEEASDVFERTHDKRGAASCHCNLSELALRRADYATASQEAHESLELFRDLQDQRGIAFSLANLAEAGVRGEGLASHDEIETWLNEALAICEMTGMEWMAPALAETRSLLV